MSTQALIRLIVLAVLFPVATTSKEGLNKLPPLPKTPVQKAWQAPAPDTNPEIMWFDTDRTSKVRLSRVETVFRLGAPPKGPGTLNIFLGVAREDPDPTGRHPDGLKAGLYTRITWSQKYKAPCENISPEHWCVHSSSAIHGFIKTTTAFPWDGVSDSLKSITKYNGKNKYMTQSVILDRTYKSRVKSAIGNMSFWSMGMIREDGHPGLTPANDIQFFSVKVRTSDVIESADMMHTPLFEHVPWYTAENGTDFSLGSFTFYGKNTTGELLGATPVDVAGKNVKLSVADAMPGSNNVLTRIGMRAVK